MLSEMFILSCHQAFSYYSPLEVVVAITLSPTMASGTIIIIIITQ